MAAIRPVGPSSQDPSGSPVPRRETAGTRLVAAVKLSRLSDDLTYGFTPDAENSSSPQRVMANRNRDFTRLPGPQAGPSRAARQGAPRAVNACRSPRASRG